MCVIRKLSSELIGRIAAGEVVERPASAVKELVENSIDAGATHITVELRDGGISYLRVSDNGRGIPAQQVRMAFERHATSKLSRSEELFDIHTLGFRGEALASIAAVSKVTLTTRTKDADFGARARVEGGAFGDIAQAASPVGTSIVVEELFYNTPVRLKFLKKPATEAALVSDYMLRLILSRPDISFRFSNQGKTVYHSVGDGKIESALYSLYGGDALKAMRRVSGHMNGALVEGYVGTGELSRGNRQQQSFFINGRYFKSALLSKALDNGCEGQVMIGRFPMCALYLQLPYQQVDVNVHPNKLEVRFQNELAVAQAVETLVREALGRESLGKRLAGDAASADTASAAPAAEPQIIITELAPDEQQAEKPIAVERAAAQPDNAIAHSAPQTVARPAAPATPDRLSPELAHLKPVSIPSARPLAPALHETVMPAASAEVLLKRYAEETAPRQAAMPALPPVEEQQTTLLPTDEKSAPLRLIGVAFDTYWIFESGDRLLLVDQHAAHERILYDKLMARYQNEHVSQRLLSPQLVRLTARDLALALELRPVLREAGFDVEPFDESSVALRAIPTLFGRNEPPRELFLQALDEWQSGRGEVTRERMRAQVAQMACKRAIKGGDKLSEPEMRGFLRDMLSSDAMPTCPHGRPIVTEVTRYALEKRFKRVQ